MLSAPKDDLTPLYGLIKPPALAYWDVIGCWFKEPLSHRQLVRLNSQCGRLHTAATLNKKRRAEGKWLIVEPAAFDSSYRQHLRLLQPSEDALRSLAKRDDALITYAEPAVDYSIDEASKLAMAALFNKCLVQHRHGKHETTIFENGNGNTGKRRRGLTLQWYSDKPSKVTGELDVFHLEARLSGSATIRRHGIGHPGDLLAFDHDLYWKGLWRKRRIALYNLDLERLGRWHDNQTNGTRRQKPVVNKWGYSRDRAVGMILYRALGQAEWGHSVQGLIDAFGTRLYVNQHQATLLANANPNPDANATRQHALNQQQAKLFVLDDRTFTLSSADMISIPIDACYPTYNHSHHC